MKTLTLALAALAAAPALAQTAPQAPQSPRVYTYDMRPNPNGPMAGRRGAWAQISPEGRDILRGARQPDREVDRAAVKAARDRVQAVLSADRLDVAALRRAMDEENRVVDAMRDKRRAAMLEAVQKLSVADRKAFAQSAQMGRDRMQRRIFIQRHRGDRPMPAPPTPPVAPAD